MSKKPLDEEDADPGLLLELAEEVVVLLEDLLDRVSQALAARRRLRVGAARVRRAPNATVPP